MCACGHPELVHHLTGSQVRTWCTTWMPTHCTCQHYTEDTDD